MFTALEDRCHCLDLQLAATTASSVINYSNSFQMYHALISEVNSLKLQIQHENEKKAYLEQILTRLLLTTLDSIAAVTNTGIPALINIVNQKISCLVRLSTIIII